MTVQSRGHGKITSQLQNEEFEWDKDGLSSADPILQLGRGMGEEGNQ